MLYKLDKSLLEIKTYMSLSVIDGELYYGYEVKSVELDEDGTIIINTDDMFDSEQTSFELYHLSHDEIQCLGSILYDAYQNKYGKRMTYKQMIEGEKPLQTKEIKYICPSCLCEFEQGDWNYNYDSGFLDFECSCCGWTGTEQEVDTDNEE